MTVRAYIQLENIAMIKFMLRWMASALLLPSLSALSQVIPSVTMPPYGGLFAQGSVTRVESSADPTQYRSLLYGGSVGSYFQFRPWLGMDARLFALASRSQTGHAEHQRAAFAGPRFGFSRKRFKVYGIALGGISHADYVGSPTIQNSNGQNVLTAATEPAMQVGGGADLRLRHGLYWRIGEVTYSYMFIPLPSGTVTPNGLSGTVFNTGLVLQIFR
jgi:hypothetical protein